MPGLTSAWLHELVLNTLTTFVLREGEQTYKIQADLYKIRHDSD